MALEAMTQSIRSKEKKFINWAQKNTCLLCDYSLDLHKHLHHIIAKDDGGTDHYLNLVALCLNHHYLIERIKRHIIPNQGSLSENWLKAGIAAKQLYEQLRGESKRIVDILSKPHNLSNVIKRGIPPGLIEKAAEDLLEEDARLLDGINKKRPRIFLSPIFFRVPDDSDIDIEADKIARQVRPSFYSEVITAHMKKLNLPYKCIKKEDGDLSN